MATPGRIKALDHNVVNKIAAGEIIIAPVNALKELLENAVDARATSVDIIVKGGGLKLLQITDNGSGINHGDLPILCERFTTSKLKLFEDLQTIGTYGFRGEALASISMVAHLTVTTKTNDSNCAWRAVYADGKLVPPKPGLSADPKSCAGRQGTQITVEDLFYNTPSRKLVFRSASEEYSKILDVVCRYAVHFDGVAFSCMKHGDHTVSLSTSSKSSAMQRIRRIYGNPVANAVTDFEVSNCSLGFKVKGILSNANYRDKKTTLLLFINGRLVESTLIKKAVEGAYSAFLPKGCHPFVYLSIEIEPQRVDVNVHPTKREVTFLHEDEVAENLAAALQEKLLAVDTSRSYALTQTLLSGAPQCQQNPTQRRNSNIGRHIEDSGDSGSTSPQSSTKKSYDSNIVRVNHRNQKITSMLQSVSRDSGNRVEAGAGESQHADSRHWVEVKYATINELRERVRGSAHSGLTELFLNHIYVGLVDEHRRLAAVQHGVKLFLVDYGAVCFEMFYQIGLADFRNFGHICLSPPQSVHGLLQIAAVQEQEHGSADMVQNRKSKGSNMSAASEGDSGNDISNLQGGCHQRIDWEGVTKTIESLLLNKRVMLRDYFSIDINDDGELVCIPLLLKGYMPCLGKLPSFLLRLGPNVDWNSELECFKTLLRELAIFYVPETLQPSKNELIEATAIRLQQRHFALESTLFPAFRNRLIPTNALLGSITEIADLKSLYKTFERPC